MDDIDKSTEILPLREPNSDFGSLWINPSDKDPTGVSLKCQADAGERLLPRASKISDTPLGKVYMPLIASHACLCLFVIHVDSVNAMLSKTLRSFVEVLYGFIS